MVISTTLSLQMQMRVGPQLVMACQMLRVSGPELEDMIRAEVESNPALELTRSVGSCNFRGWRSMRTSGMGSSHAVDWETLEERQAARQTWVEQLAAQAALLVNRDDLPVALELLYSLDGNGYLREPLEEISRRIDVAPECLERVRHALSELEPPGIGARDLRECLLIQCTHLQSEGVDCALPQRILTETWEEFTELRWNRVARKVGVSKPEVEEAAGFIARNLYPYPLSLVRDLPGGGEAPPLPDLIIHRYEDGGRPAYRLEIPGEDLYELRLSGQFERVLRSKEKTGFTLALKDLEWVEAQAELARVFIATLEQRWRTLRRVGEFLMEYQEGFLSDGPRGLKPITRAAVAEILGLHESTVSRAINDKIIQLPNGQLRPLSDLFDASLPVKEIIRTLLSKANRPLSDREISERLRTEGFTVARRTVTKYREQLNIPNGHYRQKNGHVGIQ